MVKETYIVDVFERLKNGEIILSGDSQAKDLQIELVLSCQIQAKIKDFVPG